MTDADGGLGQAEGLIETGRSTPQIRLRRFPAPFKAMLAISNDIDLTGIHRLRALHRFINTTAETPMGPGVGLDFASSMWMYRRPPLARTEVARFAYEVSYWRDYLGGAESPYAEELLAYARCGWTDTLHSYGNFTGASHVGFRFVREHAERALAELDRQNVKLPIWTNHGDRDNRQNIGEPDYMEGDDPQSDAYHADLMRDYGLRFMWVQADTHIAGKPFASAPTSLADGGKVHAFTRYQTVMDDPGAARRALSKGLKAGRNAGGRDYAMLWTARGLDDQLSAETLDRAVAEGSYLIVGQHLGDQGATPYLDAQGVRAFRRLRDYQDRGLVLTSRCSRLLQYDVSSRGARWTVEDAGDRLVVDVQWIEDDVLGRREASLGELRGLTFVVPEDRQVRLAVAGREVPEHEAVRMTTAGETTIGVRWHDVDTTDHAAEFADRPMMVQVPAGPIPSEKASALERMNGEALAWLAKRKADSVEAEDHVRYAIDYSIRRFEIGLPHYGRVMERLGFVGRRRGLDIGSGVGHWMHAFAVLNGEADGVEMRSEFVELANGIAAEIGLDQKSRSFVGDARRLQYDPETFDVAWSHGVLMFVEHDLMLAEMNRVQETGGALYLGYTSFGHRLLTIEETLHDPNGFRHVSTQASILYGAELYRQGVYRTPRGRVRCYSREELQNTVRLCGFAPMAAPGLQDQSEPWRGAEGTIDVLATKEYDVAGRIAGLLGECADDEAVYAAAADAVGWGAPEIALHILDASGLDREADRFVLAREAARLKAGLIDRPEDVAPRLAEMAGRDAQLLRAKAALNFGRWADALQALDGLPAEASTLFLRGAAHLEMGESAPALAIFEDCVARWPADLRSRVALLRAHDVAGDRAAVVRAGMALCEAAGTLCIPNIEAATALATSGDA